MTSTRLQRRRTVALLAKMSSRCKKSVVALSSNLVCATGYHNACTTAQSGTFHHERALCVRSHAGERVSRSERRCACALCMASRARRSCSHIHERKSLRTSRPRFFRTRKCIVYMIITTIQCLAGVLPRDDSRPNAGIYWRYVTYPVYASI